MSDKEKKAPAMSGSDLRNSRMHVVGMPVEKSDNFGLTARRLMGLMAGEKYLVAFILFLAVVSVALVVTTTQPTAAYAVRLNGAAIRTTRSMTRRVSDLSN